VAAQAFLILTLGTGCLGRSAPKPGRPRLRRRRRDFFVGYAQTRCAFAPRMFDEVEATADPDAPPHVRINRSVADMP
jgi:hypothetical protein